jgi:hypothetical protein
MLRQVDLAHTSGPEDAPDELALYRRIADSPLKLPDGFGEPLRALLEATQGRAAAAAAASSLATISKLGSN